MSFKHILIAGSGVLGSQIAFQTAFSGLKVTVYDINEQAIEAAKQRFDHLQKVYADFFKDSEKAKQARQSLVLTSDLATAVKGIDLVIEAIPEVLDIKRKFYQSLGKLADANTVFASNSSTLLPSQIAEYTGRPEKFLALHFANTIWKNRTAEIMGHPTTNSIYVEQVTQFARDIGMVPFVLKKEKSGYILNSLLVPLLGAAMELWVKDIADPHTIDKNWMISTGAPTGPFAILDIVGMETPYNLNLSRAKENPAFKAVADKIKTEMIDKGKMGVATGEGFYKYPNPAYANPDFIQSN